MSISVIIPCYRAAATLRRAVDSALTGAPADLEVLLVDDGSPDDTDALCDELAAADPRVMALHRANGGAGAARNTGLDAAHGDWVPPCCLTRGCWLRPTPSCSAARPSGRCGLMRALPSTRTCCLTYNFYRIPLPFIVWMVYTISSMIPRPAVCPAACGGTCWTPSA